MKQNMKFKEITLSKKFINQLRRTPETGMGYQIVDIVLENGVEFKGLTILDSEILKVPINVNITLKQIKTITLSQ